ncbi:hypothetical protein B0J11DRAFT_588857 [Dendryphion nanum]|uniref:BZIP domain-containing protein n=1 Tax=Dendryphion nanum TaxID=256645 RepID=A0A9P9ELK5_9PLEO|nr:hypothetical protein B0J11DRAFT_588857 [Dendryphion nanum]
MAPTRTRRSPNSIPRTAKELRDANRDAQAKSREKKKQTLEDAREEARRLRVEVNYLRGLSLDSIQHLWTYFWTVEPLDQETRQSLHALITNYFDRYAQIPESFAFGGALSMPPNGWASWKTALEFMTTALTAPMNPIPLTHSLPPAPAPIPTLPVMNTMPATTMSGFPFAPAPNFYLPQANMGYQADIGNTGPMDLNTTPNFSLPQDNMGYQTTFANPGPMDLSSPSNIPALQNNMELQWDDTNAGPMDLSESSNILPLPLPLQNNMGFPTDWSQDLSFPTTTTAPMIPASAPASAPATYLLPSPISSPKPMAAVQPVMELQQDWTSPPAPSTTTNYLRLLPFSPAPSPNHMTAVQPVMQRQEDWTSAPTPATTITTTTTTTSPPSPSLTIIDLAEDEEVVDVQKDVQEDPEEEDLFEKLLRAGLEEALTEEEGEEQSDGEVEMEDMDDLFEEELEEDDKSINDLFEEEVGGNEESIDALFEESSEESEEE